MASSSFKLSLKLLIDTKSNRVIFAEASKDFVDFLFNIPALALGTVTRLLTKEAMVGSLGNIYESIENLSETYIQPSQKKSTMLEPKTSISVTNYVPVLLPNVVCSTPRCFYKCWDCSTSYVASNPRAICPKCKCPMNNNLTLVEAKDDMKASASGEGGGYVKGAVKYMVRDDLVVSPMSTDSIIPLFNKFNIKDFGSIEERVVDFGMDEAIKLLKVSLQSKTVLSTLFLGNK